MQGPLRINYYDQRDKVSKTLTVSDVSDDDCLSLAYDTIHRLVFERRISGNDGVIIRKEILDYGLGRKDFTGDQSDPDDQLP